MLSRQELTALEALLDERTGLRPESLPGEVVAELRAHGLLDPARREAARTVLLDAAGARRLEWASQTVTQGDVLAAFADHCDRELEDVVVETFAAGVLVVRWRRETSRLELRNGFLGVEGLVSDTPTMLLGDTEDEGASLVSLFLDRPDVRSRLAVCDLGRLERLGTVRSSAFVYLEWFLRDTYGVKLLPTAAFTQGLIDRGIISLGMG
jgi:hypothetical protein